MTIEQSEKAMRLDPRYIKMRVLTLLEINNLTDLYEEGMTREQAEKAMRATYS